MKSWFGPFTVDSRTWLLSREGSQIELSPRLVEILAYVVERDGEIVSKDELLDRFWPDVHVTENTPLIRFRFQESAACVPDR